MLLIFAPVEATRSIRPSTAPVIEDYEKDKPFFHPPSNRYCQMIRVGTYSSSSAVSRI
jgi:hypothetical protein